MFLGTAQEAQNEAKRELALAEAELREAELALAKAQAEASASRAKFEELRARILETCPY